jgi:UDP-MurNAc hydroxylase
MRFKILSHAGMSVEGKGKTMLFDPWLIGSCYWRSWWNFPEIEREELRDIKPDYIYLTHLHWDHFHVPSMRLFGRDVTYLVPKIPGTRMVRDLRSCKFNNIVEIGHGDKFELWDDCYLHSFQFGLFSADSVAAISDGKTTLLNANDCKTFGLPLKQITNRFPKVDFVFRSHSSATPIPYTIRDYKEKFPELRTAQQYVDEFTSFSLAVGARYAVPFASNHCFLHKDTIQYNDTGVNPQMVADSYNSDDRVKASGSECVIMVPGSTWDSEAGFDLRSFDYGRKDEIIAAMQIKYSEKLEKQYEKEESTRASFKAFDRYFRGFLDSTPSLARKKLLPRLIFRVNDPDGEHLWLIDGPAGRIEELEHLVPADVVITVPAIVLNDCVRRKMFSVWSASKRLEIDLEDQRALRKLQTLFGFLDFYENEGLPLKNNFSRRNFFIWLSRWREAVEAVRLVFIYKILRRKLVISELYSSGKKTPGSLSEA